MVIITQSKFNETVEALRLTHSPIDTRYAPILENCGCELRAEAHTDGCLFLLRPTFSSAKGTRSGKLRGLEGNVAMTAIADTNKSSILEERRLLRQALRSSLIENTVWQPISISWIENWKNYVGFDDAEQTSVSCDRFATTNSKPKSTKNPNFPNS